MITDTYHLGICSWALGIPAIFIPGDYHDAEKIAKTAHVRVRHDKRKVLLGQDRLLDFSIEPYLLDSPDCWSEVIGRLSTSIHVAKDAGDFRRRLALRAATSEGALLSAIREARAT